jgi:hypothetical protein
MSNRAKLSVDEYHQIVASGVFVAATIERSN